jgi:ribonuclease PH
MCAEQSQSDRPPGELRPLSVTPDFVRSADGSVLFELGGTRVLCAASIVNGVPRRLRGTGEGWLTAEYSLLPASTGQRSSREAVSGRQGGRTVEIQRLIGRSLRAITQLSDIGERTVYVDCDVIEADGGTRCAAISGGYLALHLALKRAVDAKVIKNYPLNDSVAAVSVGIVGGMPVLDLDYAQDSTADVDMNVVMTGSGRLIEVQATAEKTAFDRTGLDQLLDLAAAGIREIGAVQAEIVARSYAQG